MSEIFIGSDFHERSLSSNLGIMSSPALPFHLINAFVLPSSPHSGNQAGVVVFPSASHPKAKDDVYMLSSRGTSTSPRLPLCTHLVRGNGR